MLRRVAWGVVRAIRRSRMGRRLKQGTGAHDPDRIMAAAYEPFALSLDDLVIEPEALQYCGHDDQTRPRGTVIDFDRNTSSIGQASGNDSFGAGLAHQSRNRPDELR